MKADELKSKLQIDRFNLDNEVVQHAELYHKAADAAALARSRRDEAKFAVDSYEAELDKQLRELTADEGERGRITEKSIAMDIQRDKERIRLYSVYLEQKRRADRLEALEESFKQRGYMIREQVNLWVSGYYQQSVEGLQGNAKNARADYNRERMAKKRRGRVLTQS